MVGLVLVAVSVGLSNFAASVGIGAAGADAGTRVRVGLVFGVFEAGMPVAGLFLGERLAHSLGVASHWFGAVLLIAAGAYGAAQSLCTSPRQRPAGAVRVGQPAAGARLVLVGLALSADNLTVGFALGTYHVGLAVAAAVFGAVSIGLSLAGLELGSRLGAGSQRRGEFVGGVVLAGTGVALLIGIL